MDATISDRLLLPMPQVIDMLQMGYPLIPSEGIRLPGAIRPNLTWCSSVTKRLRFTTLICNTTGDGLNGDEAGPGRPTLYHHRLALSAPSACLPLHSG